LGHPSEDYETAALPLSYAGLQAWSEARAVLSFSCKPPTRNTLVGRATAGACMLNIIWERAANVKTGSYGLLVPPVHMVASEEMVGFRLELYEDPSP